MKTFEKGQQIKIKNFTISIGAFNTSEVSIISNTSGDFVKLKQTKVSKKLRKVKRQFKVWLNNDIDFCFSHMNDNLTNELISVLKN